MSPRCICLNTQSWLTDWATGLKWKFPFHLVGPHLEPLQFSLVLSGRRRLSWVDPIAICTTRWLKAGNSDKLDILFLGCKSLNTFYGYFKVGNFINARDNRSMKLMTTAKCRHLGIASPGNKLTQRK